MKPRHLFPYLVALLLLAWVLGSLARSTSGGSGSILANSEWLVYTIDLLPLVALGLIIVFTVYLAVNWTLFSDALGSGLSQRRKQKKKSMKIQLAVWVGAWAAVALFLTVRCHGSLFCSSSSTAVVASTTQKFVAGSGPDPTIPILGAALAFASLVDTNIFVLAFLGLLSVGSVIMARAVLIHLDEVRKEKLETFETQQQQGRDAVRAAIRILEEKSVDSPRTRILACYQRMIKAASDLGAPVASDKTARELEKGIRSMFLLKGPGIAHLTGLFEEARYSLHQMTEEDGQIARECLLEISSELDRAVMVAA